MNLSPNRLNISEGNETIAWFSYFYASLFAVAIIVALVGNALVISSFILSKKLRTKTNYFVLNLAVADLFTAVVMVFFIYTTLVKVDPTHASNVCITQFMTARFFTSYSLQTLALIAINRWVLTTRSANTYKKIYRRRHIAIMILFSFAFSLGVSITPVLRGYFKYSFNERFHFCSIIRNSEVNFMVRLSLLPYFILMVVTILCCYGSIFKQYRSSQMKVGTTSTGVWTLSR
ncbi:G-protein coupled receptor moody [Holothuria leucospilota]|uniref:G-protein coupled receptor moody n=1 Tax=Holothuria leucospilota TaxID=206669 RepID=A0A9Q1BGZ2_HOLLE|nr:G-protein coupled receptor moody [Holothuria leucospilota]